MIIGTGVFIAVTGISALLFWKKIIYFIFYQYFNILRAY